MVLPFSRRQLSDCLGTLCEFTCKMSDVYNTLSSGVDLIETTLKRLGTWQEPETKEEKEEIEEIEEIKEIKDIEEIKEKPPKDLTSMQNADWKQIDKKLSELKELGQGEQTEISEEKGYIYCPGCAHPNSLDKTNCVACSQFLFD